MINYAEAWLDGLWIHHVDLEGDNPNVRFSLRHIELDHNLQALLKKYFFEAFTEPLFHHFTFSDGNHELNPMHQYAQTIFKDPSMLGKYSRHISKYLLTHSRHPNIKSGDLIIAYVKDLWMENEVSDALCIFKSENKEQFITLDYLENQYHVDHRFGLSVGKIDKACIIYNRKEEEGYQICAIDKSNRNKDAQFWMNDFLNISPSSNDYNETKNLIHATKLFIKDRLNPMYDLDKGEESEILTRSKDYLQHEENYAQGSYAQKVFKDPQVIEQFEFFRKDLQSERNLQLQDQFSINLNAVKNHSKVFKSILKLDKNFHVYIHGNRNMIERGVDESGRKYYKLFYDEER